MTELSQLVQQYGIATALAIFFACTNWLREKKTAEVLDEVRRFNQTTLVELIRENQSLAAQCRDVLTEANANTRTLIALVESRPCLVESNGTPRFTRPHA